MNPDNTCANCRFWRPVYGCEDDRVGHCRRMPPQVFKRPKDKNPYIGDARAKFMRADSEWPVTQAGDWCGEHSMVAL